MSFIRWITLSLLCCAASTQAAGPAPKSADFLGKWRLVAGGVRPPAWIENPSEEQKQEAQGYYDMNTGFLSSFEYLEFKKNGTYQLCQPGETPPCVYSGKWTFKAPAARFLGQDSLPRFDRIDAKTLELTYEGEETPLAWSLYRLERY